MNPIDSAALAISIIETYNEVIDSLSKLRIQGTLPKTMKEVLMTEFFRGMYKGILKSKEMKEVTIPKEKAELMEKKAEEILEKQQKSPISLKNEINTIFNNKLKERLNSTVDSNVREAILKDGDKNKFKIFSELIHHRFNDKNEKIDDTLKKIEYIKNGINTNVALYISSLESIGEKIGGYIGYLHSSLPVVKKMKLEDILKGQIYGKYFGTKIIKHLEKIASSIQNSVSYTEGAKFVAAGVYSAILEDRKKQKETKEEKIKKLDDQIYYLRFQNDEIKKLLNEVSVKGYENTIKDLKNEKSRLQYHLENKNKFQKIKIEHNTAIKEQERLIDRYDFAIHEFDSGEIRKKRVESTVQREDVNRILNKADLKDILHKHFSKKGKNRKLTENISTELHETIYQELGKGKEEAVKKLKELKKEAKNMRRSEYFDLSERDNTKIDTKLEILERAIQESKDHLGNFKKNTKDMTVEEGKKLYETKMNKAVFDILIKQSSKIKKTITENKIKLLKENNKDAGSGKNNAIKLKKLEELEKKLSEQKNWKNFVVNILEEAVESTKNLATKQVNDFKTAKKEVLERFKGRATKEENFRNIVKNNKDPKELLKRGVNVGAGKIFTGSEDYKALKSEIIGNHFIANYAVDYVTNTVASKISNKGMTHVDKIKNKINNYFPSITKKENVILPNDTTMVGLMDSIRSSVEAIRALTAANLFSGSKYVTEIILSGVNKITQKGQSK